MRSASRLVAAAMVSFPEDSRPRHIPEWSPCSNHEMAMFQAVMVDPEYRGFGLMRVLQEARMVEALRRGRNKVICKISAKNIASWQNALKFGFAIDHAAVDASGHEKMYFIKQMVK